MGMLATTGVIVSEDTFGPVSDNAAGIAEMSGEFSGEPERIMVSLDAVGNTTKAVTKGFAIGSAVIAAVALFASFIETIGEPARSRRRHGIVGTGNGLFRNIADPDQRGRPEDVHRAADRRLGAVPVLAPWPSGPSAAPPASSSRRCAGSSASTPGSWTTPRSPTTAAVIDICTAASLRELATPALLAVLTPAIIGFGISYLALGAFLAAVILTGQLMANFLSNSGGAWDNAKKYIEDGHEGGKGSDAHKAAVIGDTVGDPFKDTAGPALNPLIKVMNLVSLLILPGRHQPAPQRRRPLRHRRRVPGGAHRRHRVQQAQDRATMGDESPSALRRRRRRATAPATTSGPRRRAPSPTVPDGDVVEAIDVLLAQGPGDAVLTRKLKAKREVAQLAVDVGRCEPPSARARRG